MDRLAPTSVEEMVKSAELTEIKTVRIDAENFDPFLVHDDVPVEPKFAANFTGYENGSLHLSLALTITFGEVGRVHTVHTAEYTSETHSLSAATVSDIETFMNRVALIHLLPFVRATLADITTRLFNAPLFMPIFLPGEMTFSLDSGTENDSDKA